MSFPFWDTVIFIFLRSWQSTLALSISQITKDNNAIAEFHTCVVKDKDAKSVLLQGKTRDGLNQFYLSPTTTTLQSLSSTKCKLSLFFLNSNQFPVSSPDIFAINSSKTDNKSRILCFWVEDLATHILRVLLPVLNTLTFMLNFGGKTKWYQFLCQSVKPLPLLRLYLLMCGVPYQFNQLKDQYYVAFLDIFSKFTWINPPTVFLHFQNVSWKTSRLQNKRLRRW